jgi:hypothetical protein
MHGGRHVVGIERDVQNEGLDAHDLHLYSPEAVNAF